MDVQQTGFARSEHPCKDSLLNTAVSTSCADRLLKETNNLKLKAAACCTHATCGLFTLKQQCARGYIQVAMLI
eukprot:scaffold32102_cov18-Tisochrysis_lutea.AAC.1